MAVLSARSVAEELVLIQHLSSAYQQAVDNLRRNAIKTTVNALWRRYRDHQKREEPRSFIEWLAWKEHFESTFWHVTTGTGLATRRRWAIRYLSFLTRKELTLADDPHNVWILGAFEQAVREKQDDAKLELTIESVPREGIERYRLKPGDALRFLAFPRTEEVGE